MFELAPELSDGVELEAVIDEPDTDADIPWLGPRGGETLDEEVAAIGADTLFVWVEFGRGSASVICEGCSLGAPFIGGNWT